MSEPAPPEPVAPGLHPVELSVDELAVVRDAAQSWSSVPTSRVQVGPDFVDPDLGSVVETHHGGQPGQRYVRVLRSNKQGFEKVAPGWLQATPRASAPDSEFARFRLRARRAVLGTPLATRQMAHERLTKVKALAVLSSDALSSVAYATEQIISVLLAAGVASLTWELPIMAVIVFLLFAVVLSYRQTIKAYPQGGGSYIVAKDNLGPVPGLVAAAALMTDYILTVAVSVASGYDEIQSAFPSAANYRVAACVGMVVLIALGNLRGLKEAGSIFAAPTYLFIFSIVGTIGFLGVKAVTGHLPEVPPHQLFEPVENISIFLVLKAFSSGCSALTGVEAISDGVMAFKQPEWRNARTTLTVMGVVLAVMFIGITLLSHTLGLVAYDTSDKSVFAGSPGFGGYVANGYQTIISQVAHSAWGNGIMYFVVIIATTAVLVLAANTSFSDFPRLFFFLARDSYAPHQFGRLGDRLAYSNGILVLATLACTILVVFQANVSLLIPLYAIGVFLAFTLSQMGMVVRWLKRREEGWKHGLPLNIIGMVMTGLVLVVTAITKFTAGGYVIVIIVPLLVTLFLSINRHYADVNQSLTAEIPTSPSSLKPVCVVPIADFNAIALQSLALARTFSDAVIAIHICDDEDHIARLRAKWDAWGNHVSLEIIESPYRTFVRPLLRYIDAIDKQHRDDTLIIFLPEMVATKWWHQILHNQSALRLKAALLFRPGTVVVNVPYHIRHRAHVHRRRGGGDDPDAI